MIKFKVEVARLFPNGTWDTVWHKIQAKNEDLAKERGEQQTLTDFIMNQGDGELSHVTTVCIMED